MIIGEPSNNLVIDLCTMPISSTWMLNQRSVKDAFRSVLQIQAQKMIFMSLNISSVLTTPKTMDDPYRKFSQVIVILKNKELRLLTIMVHFWTLLLWSISLLT